MADDFKAFLDELGTRYNVPYNTLDSGSDLARLNEIQAATDRYHGLQADPNTDWEAESKKGGIAFDNELGAHKHALEVQYAQRGANTDGEDDGFSHDPFTRMQQMAAAGQGGGGGGGGSSAGDTVLEPAQAWNAAGSQAATADLYPAWYRDLLTQQVQTQTARDAENRARADALYGTLNTRANQGLAVDASDPIIKAQTDAYNAQGDRALRNYLSDAAEQLGPYGNIQGERRLGAEKLGQNAAGFQAQLLGKELTARRDEIAQALTEQGSLLTADQNRTLQAQLGQMDNAIREAGVGLQNQQIAQSGALGFADLDLRSQLGNRGLDVTSQLGNRNIDLGYYSADQLNDRFLRELALRQWDLGDQSSYRWATL